MRTLIRFSYTENVVPPRCRNPRPERFHDGVLVGDVREVTSDDAPIAIISRPQSAADGDIAIEYRWFDGKLWTAMRLSNCCPQGHTVREKDWMYQPVPAELNLVTNDFGYKGTHRLGVGYDPRDTRSEVELALCEQLGNLLMIDGVPHQPAPEPRYVVMTFGLGGNHGGTSLSVTDHYNSNIRRDSYFSLNNLEAAVEHATAVAKDRNDTLSLPIRAPSPSFEVLIAEAIKVTRPSDTVVWMRARSTVDFGPDPLIAAWRLSEDKIDRLLQLRDVAKKNHLASCSIHQSLTQWGPGSDDHTDFEGQYRIEGGRLVVDESQFYFSARIKHADREIETDPVDIDDLLSAIGTGAPNVYLACDGFTSSDVRDTVDDCGGPILRSA